MFAQHALLSAFEFFCIAAMCLGSASYWQLRRERCSRIAAMRGATAACVFLLAGSAVDYLLVVSRFS
jgi:hypothetical protein